MHRLYYLYFYIFTNMANAFLYLIKEAIVATNALLNSIGSSTTPVPVTPTTNGLMAYSTMSNAPQYFSPAPLVPVYSNTFIPNGNTVTFLLTTFNSGTNTQLINGSTVVWLESDPSGGVHFSQVMGSLVTVGSAPNWQNSQNLVLNFNVRGGNCRLAFLFGTPSGNPGNGVVGYNVGILN